MTAFAGTPAGVGFTGARRCTVMFLTHLVEHAVEVAAQPRHGTVLGDVHDRLATGRLGRHLLKHVEQHHLVKHRAASVLHDALLILKH